MYLPQIDDERDTLCNYLDLQLESLRASALGLTDEQARSTPLRSTLSISGILKHIGFCMAGALQGAGLSAGDEPVDESAFDASFRPTTEETIDVVLTRFDELRSAYMDMCRGGDLDAVLPVGPMPWDGLDEARPAALRYLYVHHVEEFARHAGHADIVREQIDGAQAAPLLMAAEGRPANAYVAPWQPA